MDTLKASPKVGTQSNFTSLPDSLDFINLCLETPPQSPRSTSTKWSDNNNALVSTPIPSIVIDSNESSRLDSNMATLPLVANRRHNKKSTSLLVRLNTDDEKESKLARIEKIKRRILEAKQKMNERNEPVTDNNVEANTVRKIKGLKNDSGSSMANEEPIEMKTICITQSETPGKESRINDRQQLIKNLTKPFTNIKRQAHKTMKERSQHSPISPTRNEDEPTPIKQSTSLRSKSHHHETRGVSEESPSMMNPSESRQALINAISSSNLSVNQTSDLSGPHKSVNLLLDYLLNNSKGGIISAPNNSKLDVANLAALAALCDLRESGEGINTALDSSHHEMNLKNLLIDLVSPPLVASSQFDLSSAGSSVEHIEVQFNCQLNENGQQTAANLNTRPQMDTASFNINFSNANGLNSNSNKKQVGGWFKPVFTLNPCNEALTFRAQF